MGGPFDGWLVPLHEATDELHIHDGEDDAGHILHGVDPADPTVAVYTYVAGLE